MGIRSIETAAEGLTKLTEEYSELLKKFDKNINDRMQLMKIEMELVEKSQKKFDKPIDLFLQTGMIASAFCLGPLGMVMGEIILQSYRIAKSDGDWQQKTVNGLIAAAKSQAAQYIADVATTHTKTLPDGTETTTNWRSYKPNLLAKTGVLPDAPNPEDGMTFAQKMSLYSDSYSAGASVDSLLSTMPNGIKLKPVGSSNSAHKSDISKLSESQVTLNILKAANRDMACRIFVLKDVMESRKDYEKISYYFGLSISAQNVNIRGSHLGLKSRDIIKLFYTGAMSQSTEDTYIQKEKDLENCPLLIYKQLEINEAAVTSRKNLLNLYKTQVSDSEIFSRTTDYQRVYETFALEEKVEDWARIDYKNQSKSLYFFCKDSDDQDPGLSLRKLHQINSESFFKLLDTKILVRAYFHDYLDFFNKKIAGGLKHNLCNYMPKDSARIQNHWKFIGKNESRVKDIIIIYFLISIPQILLGAPLATQRIIDHRNTNETKDTQLTEIERVFGAIYNGLWSACTFYKQTRPNSTNEDIWNRVSPFMSEIQDILYTPFASINSIYQGLEVHEQNKTHLEALGLSNEYIVNQGVQVDGGIDYKRNNILKSQFDDISYEKYNHFLKATTPGVAKRENVSTFERKSNMFEGQLYTFVNFGANSQDELNKVQRSKTLNAKYIYLKLQDAIKHYIENKNVASITTQAFIDGLPKKSDKYSITKTDEKSRQDLINYYSNKGVINQGYNADNYLKNAIVKVDANKQIAPNQDTLEVSADLENLFLQQKFSIEALQMKKASQEEVLKNMHRTMVALAAKILS